MPRVPDEVQREERAAEELELLNVAQLVSPDRGARLARTHDHVTERDGAVPAAHQKEVREAAVADVEEAPVAHARDRAGEDPDEVADGIGVVKDELADQVSDRCDR